MIYLSTRVRCTHNKTCHPDIAVGYWFLQRQSILSGEKQGARLTSPNSRRVEATTDMMVRFGVGVMRTPTIEIRTPSYTLKLYYQHYAMNRQGPVAYNSQKLHLQRLGKHQSPCTCPTISYYDRVSKTTTFLSELVQTCANLYKPEK
jgi:hypothetical protein